MRSKADSRGRSTINLRRWSVYTALVLIGLAIAIASVVGDTFKFDGVVAATSFIVSVAMGGLVIARRDGHTTGWLLVVLGVAIVFANGFVFMPGVSDRLAAWVGSWAWSLVYSVFTLLALTFPGGHLPREGASARWAKAAVWALPMLVAVGALAEPIDTGVQGVENPIGFLPDWMGWIAPIGPLLILAAATISLVVRRRQSEGVVRAQFTVIVFAFALLACSIAVTFAFIMASIAVGAGDPGDDAWTPVFIEMLLFPIAFAVAILRYRLFEIDHIISRTVSYALVVGVLAVVFAVIAVGLPQILGMPDDSPPLVAGATLAVAALFNPLRRRVQEAVDRRFNRARYDSQREVDSFASRLRDQVNLKDLTEELIGVVNRTMNPASAALWLRDDRW